MTTSNIAAATDEAVRDGLGHLLDQDVEGIIVIAPQQRVFDLIEELGMRTPYVALRTSGGDERSTLFIDQMEGARLATAHLLDLGHEYVRHIAGPQDWIEAEARMQGFLREMSDRDMPVVPPILGDWTADFGYHAAVSSCGTATARRSSARTTRWRSGSCTRRGPTGSTSRVTCPSSATTTSPRRSTSGRR